MKYGLKDAYMEELLAIFRTFPHIQRVLLYGSRARGDYQQGSDIDICIDGEDLDDTDLTHLRTALYESRIPYFFDVAVWRKLKSQAFIDNITRDGILIYDP